MSERLPIPLDTRVFFYDQPTDRLLSGKFVENRAFDKEGRLMGSPILRESGWGMSVPYALWFAPPPADDPRWVAGKPVPLFARGGSETDLPREGQKVLIRYSNGFVSDDTATRERLPFPGFMGGPMTRYEGVVAWMPLDALIPDAQPVPEDIINAISPSEVVAAERSVLAEELGWQLALAMQNESDLYRTHFWPFVQGALVRVQRKMVGLDDWQLDSSDERSRLIQDWMAKLAINYLAKNPNAIDAELLDYSLRIKVTTIAARHLMTKYKASREDEQRAVAAAQPPKEA